MRRFKVLIVIAMAFLLATSAQAGPNGKGKKGKKRSHGVHGTVVAVDKDSITVKPKHGKKKGGGTTEGPPQYTLGFDVVFSGSELRAVLKSGNSDR